MSDSPKPSGIEDTIAGAPPSTASRPDLGDTLPARDSQIPPEPILRSSRSSIPPVPTHRYRHGEELGRGGMGRVVEAYDTQLGRTVALKEVNVRGTSVARRFVREIEITARLEHHGIVPLYDSGTTPDGRPFYVMRRVTGKPLDQVITASRDLDGRLTLLPAMLAAFDAIAHAHKRGVIHRDLKPTNILIGEHGETVVIDWGLAKVIDAKDDDSIDALEPIIPVASDSLHTQVGSVFGTPGFMAPEQARGEELSASTDVYALGATLYQLLAGKPPMTGNSATEVIGKTLMNEIKPLPEVVDGVPPELIAIVDKALSFDERVRYRNAGELADDLRRFLDGRLVSAHDYTRRQRLSRFVRKHRTILSVIALALVAVAALAWFSLSRVLEERDAATVARKQALVEKAAAEQARDRLAERNDELVITQARSLLDTNPTQSMALLAEISPASKRIADARAVARGADVRGAWWGMQGPDSFTMRADLSPDGKLLLQTTRDNVLRVWDLDAKRLVIARPYANGVRARWVREKRVLVFSAEAAPELLDPAGNISTKLGTEPVDEVSTSDHGDTALVTDKAGAASLLELSTGTRTPVWPGHVVTELELAPDGTWMALADKASVVALDMKGGPLVQRPLSAQARLVLSPKRRLAVISDGHVYETPLQGGAWADIPLSPPGQPRMIADAIYRDAMLEMLLFGGEVYAWIDGRLVSRGMQIDTITAGLRVAGDNVLFAASAESKLHAQSSTMRLTLAFPMPLSRMRIVARPGVHRVVILGDGVITGVELGKVMPAKLPFPIGTNMVFASEDSLFTWRNMSEMAWGNIHGDPPVRIELEEVSTIEPIALDTSSGRVALRQVNGRAIRILVATVGSPTPKVVVSVSPNHEPWVALLHGNAIVYGKGETPKDGRVFARIGDGEEREVAKLDGAIQGSTAVGPLEFAAISATGELVRGNVSTGELRRVNVAAGTSMFVASDLGDRIVAVVDSRLYLWTRDVVEVTRFDKSIHRIDVLPDGSAIVILVDRDTLHVPLVAGATAKRLLGPSQYETVLDANGKVLAGMTTGYQIGLIDLASGARWSFPGAHAGRPNIALSPRGRHIVQDTFAGLVVWTLPDPDDDLAGWIHEQTTARMVGDVLTWPWQIRP
ncbi:MAG: protein kinase domain-containing protein [Kofleriaceae bacterium]